MSIPIYEQIMLPLLKFIMDGSTYDNKTCEIELAKQFGLTDDEINQKLQSGKKIFYDRLNWAKTYLRNAGLIEIPTRGKFKITQRGIDLLKENPEYIDSKFLLRYDEFKEYIKRSDKRIDIEVTNTGCNIIESKTPQERMDEAYKEIRETLAQELLQKLLEVPFDKFEEIVLDLLINMGYGGSKQEAKK
jgi:restriction system protein